MITEKIYQAIYVVVHTCGSYSDYEEQVLGVTDDQNLAYKFADQFANDFNDLAKASDNQAKFPKIWFPRDDDEVQIRRYPLNQYGVKKSKAEYRATADRPLLAGNIQTFYRLDADQELLELRGPKNEWV